MATSTTCTIDVTFTPTAAGSRTGQIGITSNDSSSPLIISLSGTGVTTAAVLATPAIPTFGRQGAGTTSAPITVTISSVGATPLAISNILVAGDFTAIANNCTAPSMAPMTSCTMNITFTPTATGGRSAGLVMSSNDPNSPLIVPMLGNVVN